MAEAWAKHVSNGRIRAHSAGLFPYGSIPEDTLLVMDEVGVALDGQYSKGIYEIPLAEMDVVVEMGPEIETPLPEDFKGRRIRWEIPDPFTRGLAAFRDSRDLIHIKVADLLAELFPGDPAG